MFATLFFGMLNPDTGQLMYITAGHNPQHIIGADGAIKASLTNTGAAVGMFPNVDYQIAEAQLDVGDTLYTYTDGVTEVTGRDGTLLGSEGLAGIVREEASSEDEKRLERIYRRVLDASGDVSLSDDVLLLSVSRPAGSG